MSARPDMNGQHGATLVVVMIMLLVVLSLGVSAAQLAMQGEKVARNDRDRQMALQAAEAALMDAERDIEQRPEVPTSRSEFFASGSEFAFVEGCGSASDNLGLCAWNEATPAWLGVDFMDQSSAAHTVAYGTFTGQSLQTDHGSLPKRLPRYIIERMRDNRGGESAEASLPIYRVTAIGFGMRETTQVVLQSMYKRGDQ